MAFAASDLQINDARRYTMNPALVNEDCRHFPSLMLFLIGQAIGLGRPDASGANNYDNDNDPTNSIPIDCTSPTRGLRVSRQIDPRSALSGSARAPRQKPARLTNDDLGGRNFLYPVCSE